jgi:cbb3-type cytochrome oxidase maturation protein
MSVMAILLVVSISVALLFLLAFIWSLKSGQFDDDFSPPRRILFDDKPKKQASKTTEYKNIKSEN